MLAKRKLHVGQKQKKGAEYQDKTEKTEFYFWRPETDHLDYGWSNGSIMENGLPDLSWGICLDPRGLKR